MHRSSGGICGAVVVRAIACAISAVVVASCGGADSSSGVGADGKVHQGVDASGTFTVSPTSLTLVQGRSVTATLTLALKSASPGTITFGFAGSPGVSATFNPASLSGSGSTTVTISAASDANIVTGASMYFVALVGSDTLLLDGLAPQISYVVRNGKPGVSVMKAGAGSGSVTSTPAGINCGVTCSAQFDLGPITLTAVPATGSAFASWSGLCTGTTLTCTFTPNDFGNVVTATFTSTAPAMSLAASPSPVTVPSGGSATSTVTVTRINGFADPVNLAVSAPAGLTVSANPTTVTGTTSTLTINAPASLPAGNYQVTITATGVGVTQQSIAVPVQVSVAGAGGTIAFNYANCEANQIPIWFAAQNGTGAWTRVIPANNTFTFTVGGTGGYAIVTRDGADTTTTVRYASATEIAAIAAANPCGTDPPTGTKRISGNLLNPGSITLQIFPTVTIGGSQFTKTTDTVTSFTVLQVPSGPRDLVAARINPTASLQSRIIIRRGTNYANNQNIGSLDFNGAEAFNPPLAVLTPLNLGGDQISLEASLLTANGKSAPYYTTNFLGPAGNTGFAAFPDSMLLSNDLHEVLIVAAPTSGSDFRVAELLIHSANITSPTPISFGPRATGVSATTLTTAPYLRLRGQVSSQTTYSGGALADFAQGNRTISVAATAAYFGSVPTTWTVDIPDLSAAGYDPAWALKTGQSTSWEIETAGGDVLSFLGGQPAANAQLLVAGAQNSGASFSRAPLRAARGFWRWR